MSIVSEAMVVNLQIGLWQGYRLDREATRKVTDDANADADAARVNKHLIPKDSLKPIVSAATAIRSHFYECTLPWKDNGDRVLTRKMYFQFMNDHSKLCDEFHAAVDTFLKGDYPVAIQKAEFRMGDLFDPDDYPHVSDLRRRFYANIDIDAVSVAGDFRVALDEDQAEKVRSGIERSMQDRINRAVGDVWQRLATMLGHFATRLGNEDAIFRDTTITNLQEIVALLPALNLTDDPELERIRQEVARVIKGVDPKDVRKDKAYRAEIAGEAQRIMDDMAGFMNAFGSGDE